jgi:hypothetical protein
MALVVRRLAWTLAVTLAILFAADGALAPVRASSERERSMAEARELLVILDTDGTAAALDRLASVARVTQVLLPRLALVRADAAARDAIRRIPGVIALVEEAPADLPPDLTPEERVFVAAWAARGAPKVRPGEGLDWDAPGFEPPDRPAGEDDPIDEQPKR